VDDGGPSALDGMLAAQRRELAGGGRRGDDWGDEELDELLPM
jgi:hypothetical protein